MSSLERVGVLIHGCHLKAEEWERIVFGDQTKAGRVPIGIEEAVLRKASLIFWGSGASQTENAVKESEYTYAQTLGPRLKELASRVKKRPSELSNYLAQVSHIDLTSQNTFQEIQNAITMCHTRKIEELYLISSPTHISRCLLEACKIQEMYPDIKLRIYARPSETCFANSRASDVVIIEPPHRGDLPKIPWYKTLAKIIPFLRNASKGPAFHAELELFIEGYTAPKKIVN